MRRRTKRALKKRVRKHGLFAAALAVLILAIVVGLRLAPRTEGEAGPWHFPQVHSQESDR